MQEPEAFDTVVSATEKVLALQAQIYALRAELGVLERTLQDTRWAINAERADQLLKANEQLVLAVLDAQAAAEAANASRDKLARLSQRDPLTDTPNRPLMADRLTSAISMAQRRNTRVAVLFMDLDGFKDINDTLGHATGDQVLQHVARLLQAAVRDSDAVGRHGGDEFIILLPEVAQITDVGTIAAKILDDIGAPYALNGQALKLSASLGIAVYPDDSRDGQSLIALADRAMYTSKHRGGGCFSFVGLASASPEQTAPRANRSAAGIRQSGIRQNEPR